MAGDYPQLDEGKPDIGPSFPVPGARAGFVERLFSVSGLTENGLVVRSREDALIALADRGLMHPGAGD
jgi:hypothetical protein